MQFLIDQPVSPSLAEWLRAQQHDAVHVRERGLSRATDESLFELAKAERRIIVTADLDFARILALSGSDHPGLILFRAGSISDSEMLRRLQSVLQTVAPDVLSNAIVVIEESRLRIARLPIDTRKP